MSDEIATALARTGLSATTNYQSLGVHTHVARLEHGSVSVDQLQNYAQVLIALNKFSDHAIPVDYWDVEADGISVYDWAGRMATHADYVGLMGEAYQRFIRFKQSFGQNTDAQDDAVQTIADIYVLCATYIADGGDVSLLDREDDKPAQHALYLWQRLLNGTTRTVLRRTPYTHGIWARHNLSEIHSFALGHHLHHEDGWGLSGFKPALIGDCAVNRNQVEHFGISAVLQNITNPGIISGIVLDIVELAQWILQPSVNFAHASADIRINRIAARVFKDADVHNPARTRTKIVEALRKTPA